MRHADDPFNPSHDMTVFARRVLVAMLVTLVALLLLAAQAPA